MNKYYNFKYSRQFLGIFIVFMGSPLIFFFKETLGFGGSSIFTLASFILGMGLMFSPKEFLSKLYKPNLILLRLAAVFFFVTILNYIVHNPYSSFWNFGKGPFFLDLSNYILIFTFFILLLGVSNNIKDYFIPLVVVLTFLGSLCLIYSMRTNVNFIIGQRATVVFGDGSSAQSGNPHVYAKNAFAGLFASILFLKTKNILFKLLSVSNLILSLVILVLTQSRATILSLFLTLAVLFYYKISFKDLKKQVSKIFTLKNIVIILLLGWGIMYFLDKQYNALLIINLYYDSVMVSLSKALLTASGLSDSENVDMSALGRIYSLAIFKKVLFEAPYLLIFGNGFKALYMDIPILETLFDCGIIAFVSFSLLNFYIFKESIKAIKDGTNPLTFFLGCYYMTYFVGIFTGGEPYGTSYWFIFGIMIRFMGIKYLDSVADVSVQPLQPSLTPLTIL